MFFPSAKRKNLVMSETKKQEEPDKLFNDAKPNFEEITVERRKKRKKRKKRSTINRYDI